MSMKYNSIEEMRRKKELLKKEVDDLQDLITFQNTKESLSAFTNGFTDKFVEEVPDEDGHKIKIKSEQVLSSISDGIKEKIGTPSAEPTIGVTPVSKSTMVETALSLGATALIGSVAKKNLKHDNWKKKLIGLAVIYLAPAIIRFVKKKLVEYQKNRSVTSMEQLI